MAQEREATPAPRWSSSTTSSGNGGLFSSWTGGVRWDDMLLRWGMLGGTRNDLLCMFPTSTCLVDPVVRWLLRRGCLMRNGVQVAKLLFYTEEEEEKLLLGEKQEEKTELTAGGSAIGVPDRRRRAWGSERNDVAATAHGGAAHAG